VSESWRTLVRFARSPPGECGRFKYRATGRV